MLTSSTINSVSTGVHTSTNNATFVQIDSFLEHLRKLGENSEAKEREQKEHEEQIRREAVRRENQLKDSLLQQISDEKEVERRELLKTSEMRKEQNRNELDEIQLREQLDKRIETQRSDLDEFVKIFDGDNSISEQTAQGIAQIAADGTDETISETSKAVNPQQTVRELTPQKIFAAEQQNPPVNQTPNPYVNENRNEIVHDVKTQFSESNNTRTVNHEPTVELSEQKHPTLDLTLKTGIEHGKQMQTLASFSDVSSRIATAFQGVANESSISGKHRTGKSNPNENPTDAEQEPKKSSIKFAELLDTTIHRNKPSQAERNNEKPIEKASTGSVELDENWTLEKQQPKSTVSFAAALDQIFTTKSRSKNVAEQEKPQYDPALSQQMLNHQANRPINADEIGKPKKTDRPMLDQIERIRFVNRVANACQSAANQNGTIRMKLHPESIGSISVKIQVKNKIMNAKIETETEDAKSLLLENLSSLRETLDGQGIRIEQFDVNVKSQRPTRVE